MSFAQVCARNPLRCHRGFESHPFRHARCCDLCPDQNAVPLPAAPVLLEAQRYSRARQQAEQCPSFGRFEAERVLTFVGARTIRTYYLDSNNTPDLLRDKELPLIRWLQMPAQPVKINPAVRSLPSDSAGNDKNASILERTCGFPAYNSHLAEDF